MRIGELFTLTFQPGTVFDSPTFMPVDDAFDDGKANPCALIGIHAM
jgi:hypothetical protein